MHIKESVCVCSFRPETFSTQVHEHTHTLLTAQAPFHTPLHSETCQERVPPALASLFQLKHAHDGAAELVKVTL